MTTLWREELIPLNEFSRPGLPLRLVRNIVIHYTANPGASAANHVIYFGKSLPDQNRSILAQANKLLGAAKEELMKKVRYASAQFFVDPIEAVLIVPLDEQAYHASQANPYSIGVEMCIEPDGSFHPETVRRTVSIVAELCRLYKLNPLRDVIRHYDVTGKVCPAPYVRDPAVWEAFKQSVDREMKGENDTLKFDEDWQWKMLGDALDGLYKKGVISDYTWAEKAYTRKLTQSELAWLNTIMFARQQCVEV